MSRRTVIVLMGTPGAGKTTLGQALSKRGWHHIELDSYMWGLPEDAANYDKVVVDCTNESEMFWCQFLSPFYDYRKILLYVDTDLDTCKTRRTHVPTDLMEQYHNNCEYMWEHMRYDYFDHAWRLHDKTN